MRVPIVMRYILGLYWDTGKVMETTLSYWAIYWALFWDTEINMATTNLISHITQRSLRPCIMRKPQHGAGAWGVGSGFGKVILPKGSKCPIVGYLGFW